MSTRETASNSTAATRSLTVGDQTYAYRRFGSGAPLLLLQHFTGTLDGWDPAVTDRLARDREVILFESAGIGRSSGRVHKTVAGMADHAMKFLDALELTRVDVLGFSLGGMVAHPQRTSAEMRSSSSIRTLGTERCFSTLMPSPPTWPSSSIARSDDLERNLAMDLGNAAKDVSGMDGIASPHGRTGECRAFGLRSDESAKA